MLTLDLARQFFILTYIAPWNLNLWSLSFPETSVLCKITFACNGTKLFIATSFLHKHHLFVSVIDHIRSPSGAQMCSAVEAVLCPAQWSMSLWIVLQVVTAWVSQGLHWDFEIQRSFFFLAKVSANISTFIQWGRAASEPTRVWTQEFGAGLWCFSVLHRSPEILVASCNSIFDKYLSLLQGLGAQTNLHGAHVSVQEHQLRGCIFPPDRFPRVGTSHLCSICFTVTLGNTSSSFMQPDRTEAQCYFLAICPWLWLCAGHILV